MFWRKYSEAKKIVDYAQSIASDPTPLKEPRLGVHLAGNHVQEIEERLGRSIPYRQHDDDRGHFKIVLANGMELWSSGNELLNNINHKQYSPSEWIAWVEYIKEKYKEEYDAGILCSPALMTLKQLGKKKWKYLIDEGAEDNFSFWNINHHPPTYLRQSGKMESGFGSYYEQIRNTAALIDFRDMTHLPVCFTEIGGGQYHYALDPMSVKLLWTIVSRVFGERLICALTYDSDLVRRVGGLNIF